MNEHRRDERPRVVVRPEDFIDTDGNPFHLGVRIVGGDGNYEQQPFMHEGKQDACETCNLQDTAKRPPPGSGGGRNSRTG